MHVKPSVLKEERPDLSLSRLEIGSGFRVDRQHGDFVDHSFFAFSFASSMDLSVPVSAIVRVAPMSALVQEPVR